MARRFTQVSEEEIKTAFFYPSDLVNSKTTIPIRIGEKRWIYTSTLRISVYIHHYSPPLLGIYSCILLLLLMSLYGKSQIKHKILCIKHSKIIKITNQL